MDSPFWGAVENLNISGGEPTTRNDLPEMVELFHRHLPRLRKIGINTTGLHAHARDPDAHADRRVLRGEGHPDQHPGVARRHRRHPRPGPRGQERLRQGDARRSTRCRRSRRSTTTSRSASPRRSSRRTCRTRRTSSPGRARRELDVVFNMLRFTDAMLHNKELEEKIGFRAARRTVHAQVLPRPRPGGIGAERPGVHVPALRGHDRQRLPAHDAVPVPEPGAAAQPERRPALLRELRRSSGTCWTMRPKRSTSRPRTSRTGSTSRTRSARPA